MSARGMDEAAVVEWAKEFTNAALEDRRMAFYTKARPPLAESNTLPKDVIAKAGKKDLTSLVTGHKDSLSPNHWNRLRDVIDLKDRESENQ